MEGENSSRMPSRNGHGKTLGLTKTKETRAREQLSIFGSAQNGSSQNGSPASLTSLDLFAGAGGIAEGLRQAGFNCLYANDISGVAIETFKANHPLASAEAAPIETVDAAAVRRGLKLRKGELDCLAGGPPCQGFSINAPSRFLKDPRNSLFKHYLRFVDEFMPKTLLFENVPGMLSLGDGLIASRILEELIKRRYDVSQKILFAAHYGVPQERWRLIILASRVGPAPEPPLPTHRAKGRANFRGGSTLTYRATVHFGPSIEGQVSVADALADLPPLRAGEGAEEMEYTSPPKSRYAELLRYGATRVYNHFAPRLAEINLARLQHIPPGGSWRDIPHNLLPAGMKKARSSDHTRRYGRLTRDGLAGTVMTKMDPHWGPAFHYSQDRSLTVREAARLQSFPDTYRFAGPRVAQYEQVGNAVPVLMARAIGSAIGCSLAGSFNKRLAGRA